MGEGGVLQLVDQGRVGVVTQLLLDLRDEGAGRLGMVGSDASVYDPEIGIVRPEKRTARPED
ncbi:hypothetical protein CKO28_03135 [Rhodovibrio sodomensis]|uniref:Uncharacterized protein n=1 Tax=Rhodovibrio sodomensis TaxID=1088 RepID=A0ABS1DBU4_9PROT|nr:hypothetical protein [Rhodovibrio sodomensis]